MIEIELAPVPNQKLTIQLNDETYEITLRETGGVMSADVKRGDEYVVRGARVVAGTPLVPYEYLIEGNFVLNTENEEYPSYLMFGTTQTLLYVTADEIAELVA
ncbi:MAG: phage baseplate plug family protein [Methylocystis sp.]|uniref:phage baseplate plug family protein n=1 Tax=Methylocystis sp. TaxID=1911079 RepID=UPI003DA5EE92